MVACTGCWKLHCMLERETAWGRGSVQGKQPQAGRTSIYSPRKTIDRQEGRRPVAASSAKRHKQAGASAAAGVAPDGRAARS